MIRNYLCYSRRIFTIDPDIFDRRLPPQDARVSLDVLLAEPGNSLRMEATPVLVPGPASRRIVGLVQMPLEGSRGDWWEEGEAAEGSGVLGRGKRDYSLEDFFLWMASGEEKRPSLVKDFGLFRFHSNGKGLLSIFYRSIYTLFLKTSFCLCDVI